MPYLRTIPLSEASGKLKEIYRASRFVDNSPKRGGSR
jgi:hypothetical protein